MRSEEQKGEDRDALAKQACLNDEAAFALVLTMGKTDKGELGRVRVSMHGTEGLDPDAADDIMRHMVDAWTRWPKLYQGKRKTLRMAQRVMNQLRPMLPERYEMKATTEGLEVRDNERGSKTTFMADFRTASEIRDMLLAREANRQRTVEARSGEAPHGAGPGKTN